MQSLQPLVDIAYASDQIGRVYEFRHLFPYRSQSVELLMESDQAALHFASMIFSGGKMEIWQGVRLVGFLDFRFDAEIGGRINLSESAVTALPS